MTQVTFRTGAVQDHHSDAPPVWPAWLGSPACFVAFDVDAKVFDSVKKLGATVVGASDEKQLDTQLEYILQRKILLEEEEPVKKQ